MSSNIYFPAPASSPIEGLNTNDICFRSYGNKIKSVPTPFQLLDNNAILRAIFGSVGSSRSHNVFSSVSSLSRLIELSIFIILAQFSLRSLLGLSQVSLSGLSYLVGQTEPKILRLVLV